MTADNTVCQTQLKLNVTICNETWHVKCEEANGAHAPCQTDMRLSLNSTRSVLFVSCCDLVSTRRQPLASCDSVSTRRQPLASCDSVSTRRQPLASCDCVSIGLPLTVRWLRPQSRSGEPIRRRPADVAVRRCWVNSFILTRLPRQLCNTGPSCKMHEHPSVRAP